MVTKTININVRDSELDDLNDSLGRTKKNIDNVEGSAKKADAGLKKVGDNGGAIATLDSFTGGLATRIRDAAEASKLFSFSLKGVQAAIVATGIGAFVVALGLVVAYWGEIKGAVTGVSAELEDQIELQTEISRQSEVQLRNFEAGENVLRLQGKSEEQINELRKERINLVLETTKAELEYQKMQLQGQLEAEQRAKGIFNFMTEAGTQFLTFIGGAIDNLLGRLGIDIGLADKVGEVRGSIFDSLFGSEEAINDRKKEIEELTSTIIAQQDRLAAMELARREGMGRGGVEGVAVLPLTGLAGMDNLNEVLDAEFNALLLQQTARTNLEEEQSNYRIWLSEQEAQAKVQSFMLAADGFAAASELIGRETAAGKAFAVASTLASTYLSAQQAFQSQLTIPTPDAPVRAAIAAATAVVSGLANVKNILAVKIPGHGGGGSVGGASPSRPPAFNVVSSSAQNQLNNQLLDSKNTPIQAFVVDREVTSAQEARRNKVEASSI